MMDIAGVDYGSKMAGTTVVAALLKGRIHFFQSEKKRDADRFLQDWVAEYRPQMLFLDAPLSLPGVYQNPGTPGSYFYRAADRTLNAMSPMFLGGLTARAMQLKAKLEENDVQTLEVYPKQMAAILQLAELHYKKSQQYLLPCLERVLDYLPFPLAAPPASWHQFDALLAFTSGWRYKNNRHQSFGDPAEGVIIV